MILTLPGQLEELQEANRKLQIANKDFYAELLYYGRIKGYKEGWAAMKYKEKFGAYPNGLPKEAKAPTVQTLGWIKSRMIAYSKGKNRPQQRMTA
jgi:hypothetical protein